MNDRFLSMFFEEARELIQALEAGLMDLEALQADREHVDRTFRAAHTLKGAAGVVGLRPIAEFTHKVEAVLDDIRAGRLAVSPGAITILLRAKDHLGNALEEAIEGRTKEPAADLEEDLVGLKEGRIGPSRPPEPRTHCRGRWHPAGKQPRSPARGPYVVASEAAADVPREPARPLIGSSFGLGPISSARESTPWGSSTSCAGRAREARITALVDALPPLEELDPTDCLLAWTVDLLTEAGREQLEEVFLFLDEPGQVAIEEVEELAIPTAVPDETPKSPAPSPSPSPGFLPEPVASAARSCARRCGATRRAGGHGGRALGAHRQPAGVGRGIWVGSGPYAGTIEALERLGRRLRDATLELRMVPIEELFVRFPRVVRDLAEKTGKRIDFRMEGEETLLDRTIVERLADPMIHLIRNAVDHGLETPAERLAEGKSPTGRITIGAGHEGDRVAVRLIDDGRGLDRPKVLRKGIALGLLPPDTSPDDPRVGNLIFEAGFSTRDKVGELSGRGVGLDVVRDAIRGLRGTVTLRSVPGRGATFLIRLPLTLAMIDGLLVEVEGARYVVPIGQVDECMSLEPGETISTMGRQVRRRPRGTRPDRLAGRDLPDVGRAPRRSPGLLLTRFAEQRMGVEVDRLLGRVQAVIQPPLDEGRRCCARPTSTAALHPGRRLRRDPRR